MTLLMTAQRTRALMALAGLTIGAISLTGCATVTRGTHEDFVVTSDPAGASVVTNNGFACDATPCTLKVPRKPGFDVTVSKPGYQTQTVTVASAMHGGGGAALAGNVLVGGIIGGIVDSNNGSLNDIVPNPLHVTLVPSDGTNAPAAAAPAAATPADSTTAPAGATDAPK